MSQGHADAVVAALMREGLHVLRVRVDELQGGEQLDELRDPTDDSKARVGPRRARTAGRRRASGGGAHSLKGGRNGGPGS